ncbi:MAG: hypothetical protein ACREDU_03535, partial [Methylocella sp.]
MFIKGSIAAGVMAAVLAFAPEAAMAKTKIHIGIGAGSDYCFHRPYWPACRFGYGYGYRFGYYRPPMGAYYSPRLYPRYAY